MRFLCEQCGKGYNIADARIAGKVVKVRCRHCGHINSVDGSGLSPGTPKQQEESLEETGGNGVDHEEVQGTTSFPGAGAGPSGELELPSPEEMGPPPDSTRMAIAEAGMAHRAEKHRAYATVAVIVAAAIIGALALDFMGVIEIPLVHAAVETAKAAVGSGKHEKKPWVSILTEEERAAIRKALLEGNQAEVEKIKRRARKRAKEKGFDIDLSDQIQGETVTSADLKRRELGALAEVDLSRDQADALKGLQGLDFKKQADIQVAPDLPEVKGPSRTEGGLEPEQIAKVVAENQGGINFCATQETKRGFQLPPKLNLTVTVVGYGKVTGAGVKEGKFKETDLAKCLVNKAKTWRFPEFTGEPVDIEIPLKFTTVN